MITLLNTLDSDFQQGFGKLLASRNASNQKIARRCAAIIKSIAKSGDKALAECLEKYDQRLLQDLKVTPEQMQDAARKLDKESLAAIKHMIDRVSDYSRAQLSSASGSHLGAEGISSALGASLARNKSADEYNLTALTNDSILISERLVPLASVAVYAPSGTASYPSSLVMGVVPAKIAGVKRIVVATPRPDQQLMAAAHLLGVKEFYAMGGAHAIAALALGSESVDPVNAICGPGSAYVAQAKQLLYGKVGIDMVAGPSEVTIVADKSANPDWVAADMLAQAEHGELSQSIALVSSQTSAQEIRACLAKRLKHLPRKEIAAKALRKCGAIIVCATTREAMKITNDIAPEHLQIMTKNPEALLPLAKEAGAIFLGNYAPEPLGDYIAGSNHILPTGGSARFASALGVLFFLKRQAVVRASPNGLEKLSPSAEKLASIEGLEGHRQSLLARSNNGAKNPKNLWKTPRSKQTSPNKASKK